MKIVTASHVIRRLTHSERVAGMTAIRTCMNVSQKENVLVVTDTNLWKKEAAVFFESAKAVSSNVTMVIMQPSSEHAQEPPEQVANMMKEAGVALLITTYSLSHTQARRNACDRGCRIASLPTITHEMILRTLPIDYDEIASLSKKIAGLQTTATIARITSSNGTDLTLDLTGRNAIADTGLYHNPGDFGNLPAGEAFIAPVEGTSNGTIVFDGCFADIELDAPITVTVKNGIATDIVGGEAARLLNQRLARVGKKGAYNIAEFGIGTNKTAQLGNNLLEVEKVHGTCHIALGNNATFGGEVDVPFHSDGVILKPTVEMDGKKIIKNREFQF